MHYIYKIIEIPLESEIWILSDDGKKRMMFSLIELDLDPVKYSIDQWDDLMKKIEEFEIDYEPVLFEAEQIFVSQKHNIGELFPVNGECVRSR